MRRILYQLIFSFLGVRRLYRDIVQAERFTNVDALIRKDLTALLSQVNRHNPFFKGKFSEFLSANAETSDRDFFHAFSRLPSFSKQDYAQAGQAVMSDAWNGLDPEQMKLRFDGRPLAALRRLRKGDFLMPMATGGSSALPLVVWMTKWHMFSMLFTFFKCWYRMGWRPGDRMLVFYPRNTYNIDDMVQFNRFGWLTGFRYHLFDHIDETTVRGLVAEINRFRPRLLLVFPSPMNMVAHTIRKLGLRVDHPPAMINVSGETFFDCQRSNIQSVFPRSRVEDSYGSVELGEIAHEFSGQGLEVFADVSYVETELNEAGQPEMVVTRLHLSDFPFIRYRMRDIASVAQLRPADGSQRSVIQKIEGKDSNYIVSDAGQRFYPSFFNQLVNELNVLCDDSIVEVKVFERGQRELEIQFIVRDEGQKPSIAVHCRRLLAQRFSQQMELEIRFVEFIDHDYRRKYRVIERVGDVEFAGGIVGDDRKMETLREIESAAATASTSHRSEDRSLGLRQPDRPSR